MTDTEDFQKRIKNAGLRVTPQRVIVLKVLNEVNHPTADQLTKKVRGTHPNIATGTIYKILETFLDRGLVRKINTPYDVMRYDAIINHHHHLQNENGDQIEDYFDEELHEIVLGHLAKKKIADFKVSDIKIQIIGEFINTKTS